MTSVKQLRTRITSVKSTQRITSAMKMVAAAKLQRAQQNIDKNRSYYQNMNIVMYILAKNTKKNLEILNGRTQNDNKLVIIINSDRGLCGSFNSILMKQANNIHTRLKAKGKSTKFITIGRKGSTVIKRMYGDALIAAYDNFSYPIPSISGAKQISNKILELFYNKTIDSVVLLYNKFRSALIQTPTFLSLIPLYLQDKTEENKNIDYFNYNFEPDSEYILEYLLPLNLSIQIYLGMLNSFASEQGARMTAMDNATRNAKEMIDNLSVTYNRMRQAQITKELIEIISGSEAL